MLLRNIRIMSLVLAFLVVGVSGVGAQTPGWQVKHGDVLQVFADQSKILLAFSGEKQILVLESDCQILRQGRPASLESLRPITPYAFQDALCWINPQGLVSHILVNYSVGEEDGILVSRDIFGNKK